MSEPIEQMTDIYGVAIDVHPVRTFRNGRQLGAGYDLREPSTWSVYDRDNTTAKWHKHCGPYSTFEQARDWCLGVREVRYPLRTCRSLHHCEICAKDITLGQRYYDGGYSRRIHEQCAKPEGFDTQGKQP